MAVCDVNKGLASIKSAGGAGGADAPETDPPINRFPPLALGDRITIARAAHGGYIATIGPSMASPGNSAAFSHIVGLQEWLDQMFKRWRPLCEHVSPRP